MATFFVRYDPTDAHLPTSKQRIVGYQAKVRRKGYPPASKTFPTLRDAKDWAKMIEADMIRSVFVDHSTADRTTLAEALEGYLKTHTPRKKGAKQETNRIKAWLRDPLTRASVSRVSGREIQQWIDQRIADGVGGTTIRNDITIISQVFEVNKLTWRIPNPVRECRLPSPGKPRSRRLDIDAKEEKRLLQACRDSGHDWLEPIVRLAIESAMRQGEILALRWSDIQGQYLTVSDSKNGESREVPLTLAGQEALRALPGTNVTAFRAKQSRPTARKNDTPVLNVTQAALEHQFRRACERAEIEDLRFHDLRHEATSRLFERGLNIIEVSKVTGHKTLQMLKRYTHPRTSDLIRKLNAKE